MILLRDMYNTGKSRQGLGNNAILSPLFPSLLTLLITTKTVNSIYKPQTRPTPTPTPERTGAALLHFSTVRITPTKQFPCISIKCKEKTTPTAATTRSTARTRTRTRDSLHPLRPQNISKLANFRNQKVTYGPGRINNEADYYGLAL